MPKKKIIKHLHGDRREVKERLTTDIIHRSTRQSLGNIYRRNNNNKTFACLTHLPFVVGIFSQLIQFRETPFTLELVLKATKHKPLTFTLNSFFKMNKKKN